MRISWAGQLLLADLRYLAGDFEGCGCAIESGYGDLSFPRAAVADGNGESGAVCVVKSTLFNHINLDGVEGEDFQRKEDLMATGDGFAVVGIDEIPQICSLTGNLLDGKGKLIDALGKRFRW